MKISRLLIVFIILLTITLGAVSAADNVTTVDNDNSDEVIISDELISDYKYDVEIPETVVDSEVSTIGVYEMPKDASGNISISVDEKEHYNQKVSPGGNALILNDLKLGDGTHSASVKYSGDNKYSAFIKNSTFEKSFLKLDGMSDEIQILNTDILFTVDVDRDVTGSVKVLIDGKTVLNEKCDGQHKDVYADGISYGKHTYEVKYTGGNHKNLVKKGSFNYAYYFDVMCDNTNISAGENAEFTLVAADFTKLTCNININGKKYKKITFSGDEFLDISDFDVGENTIEFTTTFKSIKKSFSFKINVEPKLTVPKTMKYGESEDIVLIAADSTAGNLNVKVDGAEYKSEKIANGKADITLENLSVGKHTLTISSDVSGEGNYTFEVVPYLTTAIALNNLSDLTFKASEDVNGDLTVSGIINTNVKVQNGTATIPVSALGSGKYKLNIIYENTTWDYILNVYKNSPDLDIKLEYGDKIHSYERYQFVEDQYYPFKISNIPSEFSGNISIYHDGEYVGIYDEDHEITPKFLEVGKHKITAVYPGDDYFNPINKSITYTVSKTIQLEIHDGSLIIVTPYNATGSATVKVDGKKLGTVKISSDRESETGIVWNSISLSSLKYGKTYEFEVSYSGNFPKETVKEKIKYDYEFYIYDIGLIKYGSKNKVNFAIPDDAKSQATVKIDGVSYKYTKKSNYGVVDVSKLKPGIHNIEVTYPGDKTYPAKTVTQTFEVYSEIEMLGDSIYNSINTASLSLPSDAAGDLIAEINGEFYNSTPIQNGKATLTLPTDKVGKYNYTVYFMGNYEVNSEMGTMQVKPTWKLSAKISPLNNAKLTLGFDKDLKGTVVFFADLIPIAQFDVDAGNNVIMVNKTLLLKAKSIVDTYSSWWSDSYVEMPLNAELYVNGEFIGNLYRTVIFKAQIDAQDVTMDYNDGSELKINLLDLFGDAAKSQKITVKIGSNKYKVKTNASGIATLKITEVPGNYKAKITYADISITKKVNVKQILTLKKVKVKKSAKKLVLTAKLSKKLKGKKITFKFNGKKYKAKTDKKGVAKVTIKKSVLKKLKVGKKITYTATHVKDTVKQSVKVKK